MTTTRWARSSGRPIWRAAPGRRRYSTAARCRRCWSVRWSGANSATTPGCRRVVIDLLGGVPSEGDLWVRLAAAARRQTDRAGQRRDAGPGPRWSAPPRRARQRMAAAAARHPGRGARGGRAAPAEERGPQPQSQGQGLGPQLRAQPGVAVADRTADPGPRRIVDQADGGPGQGRDHDAAGAAVRGGRLRQRHRQQARHHQVDVPEHRSGRARVPRSRR